MAQKLEDLIHGWISTDCGRGTIDILWSCLATIFLCVWTSIHLPVPLYSGKWPLTWRMQLAQSRIGTALVFVLAPELLTYFAIHDLVNACASRKRLQSFHEDRITLVHGFFLDVGGFCLKSPEGNYYQLNKANVSEALQTSLISSLTSGGSIGPSYPFRSRVQMQSVDASTGDSTRSTVISGSSSEWISQLLEVSESQIDSLAKSDTFAKLAAFIQTLWFATQVISRLVQLRATTLLEISTTAYVTCSVIAYMAWWKKPQGCNTPLCIECSSQGFPALRPGMYGDVDNDYEFFWVGHRLPEYELYHGGLVQVPWIVCTLYGAIHTGSWNACLPSEVELWIWRASCLYCLVFFTLCTIGSVMSKSEQHRLVDLILCLYGFARIFMIVEAFISLRTLPRSAYDSVEWSDFIPHI